MDDTKQQLRGQIYELNARLREIETAERDALNKALVGRSFKYRDCYSCPEDDSDYWFIYSRVTSISDGSLVVFTFSTDSHGEMRVKTDDCFPPACLGDEYAQAASDFRERVIAELAKDPT